MSRRVEDEIDYIDQILNESVDDYDLEDECDFCGSKLSYGHSPDHKELKMEEIAQCHECGNLERRKIHSIN